MSNFPNMVEQWLNADKVMAKIDEYIKNHLRYDQRFIIVRLVIDRIQTSEDSEFKNIMEKLSAGFKDNIRVTDYVSQIKNDEYLFLVRCPNADHDSNIVNRLSRMVCDLSTGKCIGRSFFTSHEIGDSVTSVIERIMH